MRRAAQKMILIDDNPDDRADWRQMLLQGSTGRYNFVEAETGQAGVRACREDADWPPDCVLLDLYLPDMDALEVLAELRAGRDWTPYPVVVITGAADLKLGRELLRAGAQDFIGKGSTTALSLVRAVENATERYALLAERREAQNRLRQSEERFRGLAEASFEGILFSEYGRIVDCNEQLAALIGCRREELLGRSVLDFVAPEQHAAAMASVHANRASFLELSLRHRDGSWRVVEVRGQPLRERPGLRVAAIRDITERKQTEVRLRRAQEELARANAGLEQTVQQRTGQWREMVAELEHMSYSMMHDMRAPLRAMHNFALLVQQEAGPRLNALEQDYLERISGAAGRMDALLTDALNYNRTVRQELPLARVETGPLLRGILGSYPAFQWPQAQVQVEGELPAVLGNEAALTQCFSELLHNAVKFVPPGRRPHVRVWAEVQAGAPGEAEPASWVRLYFEDNGTGIVREGQGRIFDMFQRMHGPEYPGTGIGLALVRKVMERMGGRVGVASEEGTGSRFWLELRGSR